MLRISPKLRVDKEYFFTNYFGLPFRAVLSEGQGIE